MNSLKTKFKTYCQPSCTDLPQVAPLCHLQKIRTLFHSKAQAILRVRKRDSPKRGMVRVLHFWINKVLQVTSTNPKKFWFTTRQSLMRITIAISTTDTFKTSKSIVQLGRRLLITPLFSNDFRTFCILKVMTAKLWSNGIKILAHWIYWPWWTWPVSFKTTYHCLNILMISSKTQNIQTCLILLERLSYSVKSILWFLGVTLQIILALGNNFAKLNSVCSTRWVFLDSSHPRSHI